MPDPTLTPMQDFCLTAIRKEGSLSAAVLKSDLRTMARAGVEMGGLDENQVIRTLTELEGLGLIRNELGGFVGVFGVAKKEMQKQGSLNFND